MFALATTRNKSFSGDQPIQETHVVCNIVAGVLTLGLACVFAGVWVRSCTELDHLYYQLDHKNMHVVYSSPVGFGWVRFFITEKESKSRLPARYLSLETDHARGYRNGRFPVNWKEVDARDCRLGFQSIEYYTDKEGTRIWVVPYWSIVIPLTLLSTWLLLSKPRAGKAKVDSLS